MRIATTLMLGAALLAGASAAGLAQDSGSRPLPAVPALAARRTRRRRAAAPIRADARRPPSPCRPGAACRRRAAPAAAPADAASAADAKADKPAVQEAKNNDAGTIDATADKIRYRFHRRHGE